MGRHPVELLIDKADKAINEEDFDIPVDKYADDAVLERKATSVFRNESSNDWVCVIDNS